jgi:protein-tyrosine phosphatase
MAEAIARDLLRRAHVDWVSVGSAGIAANEGASMTPEAREALSEMDVAAGSHRSRMLTPALVSSHQKIYALTRAHLRATQQSVPQSESTRIQLLDPQCGDIEDPIGGPLEEYRETAANIRKLVRLRLAELGIELPAQ